MLLGVWKKNCTRLSPCGSSSHPLPPEIKIPLRVPLPLLCLRGGRAGTPPGGEITRVMVCELGPCESWNNIQLAIAGHRQDSEMSNHVVSRDLVVFSTICT